MKWEQYGSHSTRDFFHPSSFILHPFTVAILRFFRGRVEAKPAPGVFEPAARGAFRVLGLVATAAQGEVFDAASSVRLALKLGVRKTFESDAAHLFGPAARDESDVRDAVGRLSESAQRARERLFWFHTNAMHAAVSNVAALTRALDALLARVPVEKFDADGVGASHETEGARLADEEAGALHDAALLALCGVVRLDPALRDEAAWARAFDLWRRVFACEEFWTLLVAADLKGDYEQPVTFGEVAELRRAAPRVVSGHAAVRAGAAVRRGDLREAARALRLLRGAGLPASLMQEYENEVVGPAEDATVEELDKAFGWVGGAGFAARTAATRRNHCNEAWRKFEALRPRLAEFAELAGADSYSARRVFEHAATKLFRLAVAFEEAKRPQEALFVCRKAHALAPPGAEELPAIESKLRALGAAEESREWEAGEYAAALAVGLSTESAPWKLFRDDKRGSRLLGSFSKKSDTPGCLTSVAFWLVLVVACFGLQRCGVINMRSRRTSINSLPPSLNIRPDLNFNHLNMNYNIPPPLNLRPYAEPPPKSTRQPGGKGRRPPRGAASPTPTTGAGGAPNVNSSPPR
ncbi:MAG TPA: hypothetical protein VFZ44_04200 [Pyrinomonadaceae bacterium]